MPVGSPFALDGGFDPDRPFETAAGSTLLRYQLARRSLASLIEIVDSLRGRPGRKVMVLLSEGFPTYESGAGYRPIDHPFLGDLYGDASGVRDAQRSLADLANRAQLVMHVVDPRALVPTGPSAADDTPEAARRRHGDLISTIQSLIYVAEQTGGLAVYNQNDLAAGLTRIAADSAGCYLLGYEPDAETFSERRRPRLHEIDVKVLRKSLKVRSRRGFYGLTDEQVASAAPRPAADPIRLWNGRRALSSSRCGDITAASLCDQDSTRPGTT